MRRFLLLAVCSVVLLAAPVATARQAPATPGADTRVASLREQLIRGLRATRPEQQMFLQEVIKQVDAGRLHRGLVNAVYKWSQERFPPYPFPFFERGIRVEARKRGVDLPSVDLIIRSGRVAPVPLPER